MDVQAFRETIEFAGFTVEADNDWLKRALTSKKFKLVRRDDRPRIWIGLERLGERRVTFYFGRSEEKANAILAMATIFRVE